MRTVTTSADLAGAKPAKRPAVWTKTKLNVKNLYVAKIDSVLTL